MPTTYYVRKTGSGSGGLTPATAFTTIAAALSVAASRDVIIVGAGAYSESISTALKDIRIIGDYHGVWTGDKGDVTITNITMTQGMVIEHINATGTVTMDTNAILKCGKVGGSLTASAKKNFSILNCYLLSISITDPLSATIDSCTIDSNTAPITVLANSPTNHSISISNTVIKTSSTTEFFLNLNIDSYSDVHLDNNIYWRTNGRQNSFMRNTGTGYSVSGLPDWQLSGNDQNSTFIDPSLVNAYIITALSPAYGMGSTYLGYDISGTMRTSTETDIGCYHLPRGRDLPLAFEERRFRYEYPLESAHVIDQLAFFQQFMTHYFGLDSENGTVIRKGLVQTILGEISSRDIAREQKIETPRQKFDNIIGNLVALRNRKW